MRALLFAALALAWLAPGQAEAQNRCGSGPISNTPVGPVITRELRRGSSERIEAKFWRIPCSQTDSMLVGTMRPISSGPFVCAFTLIQNGLQTTNFRLLQDPGDNFSTFCGALLTTTTLAFVPGTGFPASFDLDGPVTINYDGGASQGNQQIQVPAYDPGAYGPPVPRPTRNYTGQWHQPAEGGRGLSLFQFPNNVLFGLWFVYDAQGRAAWYQLDIQWVENDKAAGVVGKWTGPAWGPTYSGDRQLEIAGTYELIFTAANRASLTYNVDGVARTVQLQKIE